MLPYLVGPDFPKIADQQLPETEARLRRDGLIADPMNVEQFNAFIDAEVAAWKPVMERTGLIGN